MRFHTASLLVALALATSDYTVLCFSTTAISQRRTKKRPPAGLTAPTFTSSPQSARLCSSQLFSSPEDQEDAGSDEPSGLSEQERQALEAKRQEVLAATRDPFALIRTAIWGLLLLGSLVGLVTSITGQSTANLGGNLQNIAVNAAVVVAMCGALFFENQLGNKSKEIVQEEMDNPMLKGGSGFYLDDDQTQK